MIRSLRQLVRTAFLGLSFLTLAVSASADAPTQQAQAFVEKEHGRIKQLVDSNAPQSQVTQAIDGMVDYQEIAMRALGKPCPATIPNCVDHWDDDKLMTPERKKEVTELFKAIVERKYRENAYKTKDFDVTYRGTKDQGDLAKVRTEAKNKTKPRDPPVQVDYIVRCTPPKCSLVDMVTEGSILSKNYYDQSHKMLTTEGQGYPYFVQKLKDRAYGKKSELK
jgi:ABC-type transporter MlaC component